MSKIILADIREKFPQAYQNIQEYVQYGDRKPFRLSGETDAEYLVQLWLYSELTVKALRKQGREREVKHWHGRAIFYRTVVNKYRENAQQRLH